MKLTRRTMWLLVWAMAVAVPGVVVAQSDEDVDMITESEPETTIRVVQLKHVQASQVANTIEWLGLPVMVHASGQRMLVLSGGLSAIEEIEQKLVNEMDLPITLRPLERERETAFVSVRHYPVNKIRDLVRAVAPTGPWALDEFHRTIVLNGPPAESEAVSQLLEKIDRPFRSAQLQFYFLRADIGASGAGTTDDLPPNLMQVAGTLRANGFHRLTLMAPVMVNVVEGQTFESTAQLNHGGETPEGLVFRVEGVVRFSQEGETVSLELRGRMGGEYGKDKDEMADAVFELNTTVETKLGDYVILAAAPASTATGSAVALVVRVTRP